MASPEVQLTPMTELSDEQLCVAVTDEVIRPSYTDEREVMVVHGLPVLLEATPDHLVDGDQVSVERVAALRLEFARRLAALVPGWELVQKEEV